MIFISFLRLNFYEFFLLSNLVSRKKFGSSKTLLSNQLHGVARDETGFVKQAYKELKRKSFFKVTSQRGGEEYFSIDPRKSREINEILISNSCPYCHRYLENIGYCNYCKKQL